MYWFSPRHHNGWHRGYWGPRYRPCGCGGLGCLWLLLMPLLFCAAWAVLGIMAPVTWW